MHEVYIWLQMHSTALLIAADLNGTVQVAFAFPSQGGFVMIANLVAVPIKSAMLCCNLKAGSFKFTKLTSPTESTASSQSCAEMTYSWNDMQHMQAAAAHDSASGSRHTIG